MAVEKIESGEKQTSGLGRALWARLRGIPDPLVEGTPPAEEAGKGTNPESLQALLDESTCEGETGSVTG